MAVRVRAPARLHFGFQNLSLVRERLYGGIGAAITEPAFDITVETADSITVEAANGDVEAAEFRPIARQTVEMLDVPGLAVTVHDSIPHHVGLGSGTQRALATFAGAVATYDRSRTVRDGAPGLGRGGRSGIGVAAFESGGFIVDGGHPVEKFTVEPPKEGDWRVPPVVARHPIPSHWRFVVIVPDVERGRHGPIEEAAMRSLIERASPAIAAEIASICLHRLLPAIADSDRGMAGQAITEIGRLNGAWYADLQGGVYREAIGPIIRELAQANALDGVGQSSWGPTVFGLTATDHVTDARRAARRALESTVGTGTVQIVEPRNSGATIELRD